MNVKNVVYQEPIEEMVKKLKDKKASHTYESR
nr:MAG TPA: hypothetical protein [Caudoviricetes sp.]